MVKVLCYKSEGRLFDSSWCHWNFSLTLSSRSHYGPGVDSASNRNEYQEHFLGVKSGWCVGLTTLPPSCAVVMKSGNLNFLELSGNLGPVTGLIYLLFNKELVTILPLTILMWLLDFYENPAFLRYTIQAKCQLLLHQADSRAGESVPVGGPADTDAL